MLTNWFRMSAASRLPWKPCLPVMQKRQPMRQPAWELTQSVLRSPSGIITASTEDSSGPEGRSQTTGNRYLRVPSEEVTDAEGAQVPRSKVADRLSLAALDMLDIPSQLRTRFEYSHPAICLPTNGLSPQDTAAASSSPRVFPSSFSFIAVIVCVSGTNLRKND